MVRFFYSGYVGRKIVMLVSFGVAIFRIVILPLSDPFFLFDVNSHSSGLYSYFLLALGFFLLFTIETRRNTVLGLLVSLIGFGLFASLSLDVWPIVSSGTYFFCAVLLLLEGSLIWDRIRRKNGH